MSQETGTAITESRRPKSVLMDMADRYGMEAKAFEATVRATCMPTTRNDREATKEEFAAFLLVAKEYNLNPLTKEIYAFPRQGGGIVPVVSIDGWVRLINEHPKCDGWDFEWTHDGEGNLVSCTCRMHRKDRKHAMEVTEYLVECMRPTEPWKMKHRMLRHKAMIQSARYAFGFAGIYDEDEGERIRDMTDITPEQSTPPPPPPPPTAENETIAVDVQKVEEAEVIEETPSHTKQQGESPDEYLSELEASMIDAVMNGDRTEFARIWDAHLIEVETDNMFPPDIAAAEQIYKKYKEQLDAKAA